MIAKRWHCPEHGVQETRAEHSPDDTVRCALCGRPMVAEVEGRLPAAPREKMPPRGESRPL